MAQINRTGTVHFHDASLHVWEEGIAEARAAGGIKGADQWEREFKRDVFGRIVQQLRRLGWTVSMPAIDPHYVKHYGGTVARWAAERHRNCHKGDLKGELEISGRTIKFQMWQSVNTPTRPDHDGKYESDKEGVMPYVLRLEMTRTRNRLRDYLCNVFSGYTFNDKSHDGRSSKRGPNALDADQWIAECYRTSWHFKGDWEAYADKPSYNRTSKDGALLDHGQRVFFFDRKGRIGTGTAFYNINNMWWIKTGRYDVRNLASHELYTELPANPRLKRNERQRRKRLESELAKAVKEMNFERAAVLRDIAFPKAEPLYLVWHGGHKAYHCPNFESYTADPVQAGRFTLAECKGYDREPNRLVAADAAMAGGSEA